MFIQGIAGCLPNGSCQLAAYSLPASNILDHRAQGWCFWIGTTEGHPPNRGNDCVHVGHACSLIPHDAAGAHHRYPRGCHHPKGHGTQGQFKGHLHHYSIHRHTVTPTKPHGGVHSHMSANACTSEEGLGGMGVLGGETGGFMGFIWGSWLDPTLGFMILDGWGISPAATTGQDGCGTFSHPKNFGHLLSGVGSSTQGTSGTLAERVFGLSSSSFLGRTTPQKTSSSVKERYHFTSSLSSITLSLLAIGAHLQQADYFLLPNAGGP